MTEAGARFESYVRVAMNEAAIASMAELGRRSGIAPPVWYTWFRGEKQPRKTTLTLAGQALERTPEQLLSVWEGQRPHAPARATETPDALVTAIEAQTAAITDLVDVVRQLLDDRG